MADKVKVVIAFDRDSARIGKTVEVPEAEARVLITEGRARLAEPGKGKAAVLASTEPTRRPPRPDVVPPADEAAARAAASPASKGAGARPYYEQ